ncbi:MAG TPA: alpha/beta hydrolase [Tepidisphaeraceae bacterium]|jgi:pimeloyl-ACP methyl ester carboxylesterase
MQNIEIAGAQGGYLDEGAGPPLVLLVTPFITADLYWPTRRALMRSFRVITVELPGTASHPSSHTWSFEAYAQWTAELLDRLALDCPLLIGHSSGGAIALMTGLLRPRQLCGVVLADAVGMETSHSFAAVIAGCLLCVPVELRFALRLFPRVASNLRRHTRNFLFQVVQAIRRNLRDQARRLAIPALVAWGAIDYVMPISGARTLMRWAPHARLYVCGRGSHDWLIVWPNEFAAAVERFASGVRGG